MTFATISEMKTFCAENGIVPIGNKSYKATWQNAIDGYFKVQAEIRAAAVDVQNAAIESASQSVAVADVTETAATIVVVKAVEALTSPEAIGVYKLVLRSVVTTIAFVVLMAWTLGKWCWGHREHTAVYHWVEAWLDSPQGKGTIAYGLVVEWIVASWVEAAKGLPDRLAQVWRSVGAIGLVRVGLG